jgi:thiol-disulfide isomerase/thioredoxin
MKISRSHLVFLLLCYIGSVFFAGCTGIENQSGTSVQTGTNVHNQADTNTAGSSWMTIPFTDAVTGINTSIDELASLGKPVIIHTFAIWCPACSVQLEETAKFIHNNPEAYSVLGIDVDSREDPGMIKRHVDKNQFAGMYAASPTAMTRSLIDTFGIQIIRSLPQTMVICNKSITYIGDGAFSEEKLQMILSTVCEK